MANYEKKVKSRPSDIQFIAIHSTIKLNRSSQHQAKSKILNKFGEATITVITREAKESKNIVAKGII